MPEKDSRLAVFVELNSRSKGKDSWQERVRLVSEVFPQSARIAWGKAFSDIELFGQLIREILKDEQAEKGRSGPRPNLDRDRALAKLREYMGNDYSELPFPLALRALAGTQSIRGIARKTNIAFSSLQRFVGGERPVDMVTLETIAQAYRKDPGYFLEYRVAYVLAALGDHMVVVPETTVGLYRRIKGGKAAA